MQGHRVDQDAVEIKTNRAVGLPGQGIIKDTNKEVAMPLNSRDRLFLRTVDRLKVYLLLLAIAVFIYLMFIPADELRMATSVIGVALCVVFWLTSRLLTFITSLDLELTRLINALKRSLPEEERQKIFPG